MSSPFKGHIGPVRSVALSSDGDHIVSGSDDRTIRIWNITTGQTVLGPFQGHTGCIMSVAFSSDDKHIVSGSADKTIRIWDAEVVSNTDSYNGDSSDEATPLCYGFHLDHLSGWASQHPTDSMIDSKATLLFWVPPHNRWGICGSETTAIMGASLNKLEFGRFVHGHSWTQCYLPPSTIEYIYISQGLDALMHQQQIKVFVLLLIFVLLLLLLGLLYSENLGRHGVFG